MMTLATALAKVSGSTVLSEELDALGIDIARGLILVSMLKRTRSAFFQRKVASGWLLPAPVLVVVRIECDEVEQLLQSGLHIAPEGLSCAANASVTGDKSKIVGLVRSIR